LIPARLGRTVCHVLVICHDSLAWKALVEVMSASQIGVAKGPNTASMEIVMIFLPNQVQASHTLRRLTFVS
jgi:hypothetical protein